MPSRARLIAFTLATAPIAAASAPALAQQPAQTEQPAPTAQQAAPAASAMTPAQITAFNKAVTDFSAGQTAQQAGDNSTAAMKYEAALPAIRTAVQVDPTKIDNVAFLANVLYADAAAQAGLGKLDKAMALFGESAPHWRKVVEAKPADTASRNVLAGILVQLGNQKLTAKDASGADPYYQEAVTLARKSVADNATDKVSKNLLLSALIGASQTGGDPAVKAEALSLGKAMMADNTIDAVNKPSIEIMTGQAAG